MWNLASKLETCIYFQKWSGKIAQKWVQKSKDSFQNKIFRPEKINALDVFIAHGQGKSDHFREKLLIKRPK